MPRDSCLHNPPTFKSVIVTLFTTMVIAVMKLNVFMEFIKDNKYRDLNSALHMTLDVVLLIYLKAFLSHSGTVMNM